MHEIKKRQIYAKNLEEIFPKLFGRIIGSPEVDNLVAVEMMLRTACDVGNYKRALEICSVSRTYRNHESLVHPFGPILQLVEEMSISKTYPQYVVYNERLAKSDNQFERALLSVKNLRHAKSFFWYETGMKIYLGLLQKAGKVEQIESFCARAKSFSLETMATMQMRWSSRASSLASVNEFLEVPISDIKIDLIVCSNRMFHDLARQSFEKLKVFLLDVYGVCSENTCMYFTENFETDVKGSAILSLEGERMGQIILVVQIGDSVEVLSSVEQVKEWVTEITRESTKFTWLMVQNIQVPSYLQNDFDDQDPEIEHHPVPQLTFATHKEIIVAQCSAILRQYQMLLNMKLLSDCLITVLREEKNRIIAALDEIEDWVSVRGYDPYICVQDICMKMQEEISLNEERYIIKNLQIEKLETKLFHITFQH